MVHPAGTVPRFGVLETAGLRALRPETVDILFTFGPGEPSLPAHKILLASVSDTFHAQFYGALSGPTQPRGAAVRIHHSSPEAFATFLNIVYGELQLLQLDISAELLVELFHLARYYQVAGLAEEVLWRADRLTVSALPAELVRLRQVADQAEADGHNEVAARLAARVGWKLPDVPCWRLAAFLDSCGKEDWAVLRRVLASVPRGRAALLQLPLGSTITTEALLFLAEKLHSDRQLIESATNCLEALKERDPDVLFLDLINGLPEGERTDQWLLQLLRRSLQRDQIFLRDSSGRTVTLQVRPLDTVADIKVQVESKIYIPESHQRLTAHGLTLDDCMSIAHCGIHKDSTIQLFIKLSAKEKSELLIQNTKHKSELELTDSEGDNEQGDGGSKQNGKNYNEGEESPGETEEYEDEEDENSSEEEYNIFWHSDESPDISDVEN